MARQKFESIQATLTVSRKLYITPHYVRIFFKGDNLEQIANTTVGVNNKIFIPPAGINEVHFPEFDFEAMQWKPQPEAVRPTIRTYTHRGIDLNSKEIWIDFVAHGDEGPASSWAIHAQEGDTLGLLMRDGKTELYRPARHYLLVGDATAIPVLGAILEDLPSSASGTCIIEVQGKSDEQYLHTNAAVEFIWLHNAHPQDGSHLAAVVKEQNLPLADRFAYVAAEFSSVREIRRYLRKEKSWQQSELYAYSYWKSGVAEDRSIEERHLESEESN